MLDKRLIQLLNSLTDEEWHAPTIAPKWNVKDIAAHLLDGNLRGLSIMRDKYNRLQPGKIDTYKDLVFFLNELNAEWTAAAKRMSPKVITNLLEISGQQYADFLHTLDPWDDAVFSVAWAGEEVSKNWFHIAREYTEKWIHQQQIRAAVGKEDGIMTRELFYPFIDTFMCGLPHTYKYADVPVGTSVEVEISTQIGGIWHINKTEEGWVLRKSTRLEPDARVEIKPDTAWKLFSKGIAPEQALDEVNITGDEKLGAIALGMVSVMA
jgi:uncharacterized protein (TIGR03083 family)